MTNTIESLEIKLAQISKRIETMIKADASRVEANLKPERLHSELLFSVKSLLDSEVSKGRQS